MVRAKFKCTHKTAHLMNVQDGDGKWKEQEVGTVKLAPVSDDANKEWSIWTPCGSIEMTINNPSAYQKFKLGQEYFIDFTLPPKAE